MAALATTGKGMSMAGAAHAPSSAPEKSTTTVRGVGIPAFSHARVKRALSVRAAMASSDGKGRA